VSKTRQAILDASALLEALRPVTQTVDWPQIEPAWNLARSQLKAACAAWVAEQQEMSAIASGKP
jgi:hypothetical protein